MHKSLIRAQYQLLLQDITSISPVDCCYTFKSHLEQIKWLKVTSERECTSSLCPKVLSSIAIPGVPKQKALNNKDKRNNLVVNLKTKC